VCCPGRCRAVARPATGSEAFLSSRARSPHGRGPPCRHTYVNQSRSSRQGHPRREAGPQKPGTPPEFAGLPKETKPRRSPAWREARPRSVVGACSPIREDFNV
jgi:hypothetical protein